MLAAGQSKRMGETNKLLAEINGKTLLQHVITNLKPSIVDTMIIVTGHKSQQIVEHICGQEVVFARNDGYQKGLSSSIKTGIEKIQSNVDAALIVQADMPFVETDTINQIVSAFDGDRDIVVPRYQGQIGNPLLWPRYYFEQLKQLSGDRGAKQVLYDYQDNIIFVDVDNIGVLTDIDDPAVLAFFQNRFDKV